MEYQVHRANRFQCWNYWKWIHNLSRLMTKPTKWHLHPAKTKISLRVFAVCMKKAWVLSYPLSAQRRLWSNWADAQADLSLRWAHSDFVGFVMRQIICGFCSCVNLGVSLTKNEWMSEWILLSWHIDEISFLYLLFIFVTLYNHIPERIVKIKTLLTVIFWAMSQENLS